MSKICVSSDNIRDYNIYTTYGYIEKEKLNEIIINIIIEFVYILFVMQIIRISVINFEKIKVYYQRLILFKVYYFENKWIKCNVEDY